MSFSCSPLLFLEADLLLSRVHRLTRCVVQYVSEMCLSLPRTLSSDVTRACFHTNLFCRFLEDPNSCPQRTTSRVDSLTTCRVHGLNLDCRVCQGRCPLSYPAGLESSPSTYALWLVLSEYFSFLRPGNKYATNSYSNTDFFKLCIELLLR